MIDMNTGLELSRTPSWYDERLQRCECNADRELVEIEEGYSDATLLRVRCVSCGAEWCRYLEG